MGSVIAIFDANGTRLRTLRYDAFGNILKQWGTFYDAYAYIGKELDTWSNLQFNNARWYDPELGRWINQDPLGYGAGDMNLYRYVGNNATNYKYPSGYFLFSILGTIIGGGAGLIADSPMVKESTGTGSMPVLPAAP